MVSRDTCEQFEPKFVLKFFAFVCTHVHGENVMCKDMLLVARWLTEIHMKSQYQNGC